MTHDQQARHRFFEAFLAGKYDLCVELSRALEAGGVTLQTLQLLLISLQRLKREAEVAILGPEFLEATRGSYWDNALLQLTLGLADLKTALSSSVDATQRFQANFYAAARLVTLGQIDDARRTLENAIDEVPESNARRPVCQEYFFALGELHRIQTGRAVPREIPQPPRREGLTPAEQQVQSLISEAAHLHRTGLWLPAIDVAKRALNLARKHPGDRRMLLATAQNNLAGLYMAMSDSKQAETLFQESSEIVAAALGREHPLFGRSLNNLAELARAAGDDARAERMLRKCLEIQQAAHGEQHPDYAFALNNLGQFYKAKGDYPQAEALLRQASEVFRLAGQYDPSYATILNNLAGLYHAVGQFARAEELYDQVMDIVRGSLGEAHPLFATCLNNLAGLYATIGDYAHAEMLHRQAQEIYRDTAGDRHPDFAAALNNLAGLYMSMGDSSRAEPLYVQASTILRESLGERHPRFAASLSNLALVRGAMGNLSEAIELYHQAIGIHRAAQFEPSRELATCQNNLALAYAEARDYTRAIMLSERTLANRRTLLGERHPEVAASLHNLAGLYNETGQHALAEPLYEESAEIFKTSLGKHHPFHAASLHGLAALYAASDRPEAALQLMREVAEVDDRLLGQIFSMTSDRQRAAYLLSARRRLNLFLSLVHAALADRPEAVRAAFDLVLRRKAVRVEADAVGRRAVLEGKYPLLAQQLRELHALCSQIVRVTLDGPGPGDFGPGDLASHGQQLIALETRRDNLERELTRQIPEMNLESRLRAADRRAVALALPEGSTLIEFVQFDVFDFKASARQEDDSQWLLPQSWQPARYLAFVLPAGQPDQVQMIDLGAAAPIDWLIRDFRDGVARNVARHADRDLGAAPSSAHSARIDDRPTLRSAVFDWLAPALADCKRLLIAPDGDLSRLTFEVLAAADGRRLIEEYTVSYVSCGRDVLRFGAAGNVQPTEPVVVADPDFDLGDRSPFAAPAAVRQGRISPLGRDVRFGRLRGTRLEGEAIAARLGVTPWLDAEALESRLKACRSPRILHLATHGYFLANHERDPNGEIRDLGALPSLQSGGFGRLVASRLEDPLLRSGLALAGVNQWLKGSSPPAEAEDGLLTAADVSGMNLLETDLVVLSACDTGLGAVRVGEGVFGLRRAFVLAGAKTLVMSLWKVPDQETRELMEDFYQRLLAGQSRADSLRDAQLAMKARIPNPLYWGAFICLGDPAPLPRARPIS